MKNPTFRQSCLMKHDIWPTLTFDVNGIKWHQQSLQLFVVHFRAFGGGEDYQSFCGNGITCT